ncbi:MAG: DUF512 domain-containing protein [Candidatus Rokubacteria bacterium]|nr:DUF512 domain-containing protein [Candidatus Rokubacteria bacterium]
MKPRCTDDGVVVAAVGPRTPAAKAGLRPGDRIVAVNGERLRDAIDFQFHAGDDVLDLTVDRAGRAAALALTRRGADLGVELEAPRPGEIATCANKCVFCFIHQLPTGMRKGLYVKDDDFRLSFLHGNYITLTDLDEAELRRIEEQRLSPLYISVHATDPALRHRLLGNPRHSTDVMPRLRRLARAGIRMHAQIVLCPEWNDGAHLERTVFELAPLHPHVATVAIVPVGLTAHRQRLPTLRTLAIDEARQLVVTVGAWQRRFLDERGSRFVFLGDEVYLQAGAALPDADAYEGFAIAEDGIGLVRPVPNRHFGGSISVAGLLTGRDIQRTLAPVDDLGDAVLVPAVAVRDVDGVFLDDLTPRDLAGELGVPVRAVEPTAAALLAALMSGAPPGRRSRRPAVAARR